MNLRRLQLFVILAEELHFNRAAQRLHMAQPPLSQQIRKLETELGVELFLRSSRNVQLTTAGVALQGLARKLLDQVEELEGTMGLVSQGKAGRLRLGFVSSAASSLVPEVVRRMQKFAPELPLELEELTTELQITRIFEGALDAGLARDMTAVEGLEVRQILVERLIAAVPTDHALAIAGRSTIPVTALKDQAFVGPPRARMARFFDRISGLLESAEVHFDIKQEAVQFPTILGLVASGVGIAIVPNCMRVFAPSGVKYLEFAEPEMTSTMSLINSKEFSAQPACATLATVCMQMLPSPDRAQARDPREHS